MIQNKPDELVHTGHFYCFYSFLLVFTKKSQFIKTQKVYSKMQLTLTDAKYTISCQKIQGNIHGTKFVLRTGQNLADGTLLKI